MKKAIKLIVLITIILSMSSCWTKEEKNIDNNKKVQNEQNSSNNEDKVKKQIQEETSKDIKDISEKVLNWEMTAEEAQKAMVDSMNNSKTFKNQLEKSKYEMPKFLEILKFNKKCLSDADTKGDADECEKQGRKLAKKLGISDMYPDEPNENIEWNSDFKEQTLKDIDKWIEQFETMLPCINKAKTVSDMMKCWNNTQ